MKERKVKWRKVGKEELKELNSTPIYGKHYLRRENFISFIHTLVFRAYTKYHISSDEFLEHNKEFYQKLNEVFKNSENGYAVGTPQIEELKSLIYVPDEEEMYSVNYQNALKAFKKLSEEEKEEFKKEINSSVNNS